MGLNMHACMHVDTTLHHGHDEALQNMLRVRYCERLSIHHSMRGGPGTLLLVGWSACLADAFQALSAPELLDPSNHQS